jgi:hypothetical protein
MRPVQLPPASSRFATMAGLTMFTMLQRAAEALIPAPLAMMMRVSGFWQTQLIHVAARLDIADRVAKGAKTAAELAKETGANEDALHRTLRALAAFGIFTMDGEGRVANNRLSETLRKGGVASMHGAAEHFGSRAIFEAWGDFERTVMFGEPAFRRTHGVSLWDWLASHDAESRAFAGAMTGLTEQDAPTVAASYPWGRHARICDVAGGHGALLAEILVQHEKARGVLFEEAHVLEAAAPYLAARGVEWRVERVAGSFFAGLPKECEGCDAYVLKDILHDWDDARALMILANVRRAMKKESALLVCEVLVEPFSTMLPGPLVDVQVMNVCEGGRQRSEGEMGTLLGQAGLRVRRVHATATAMSIVEVETA